MLSQEVEFRMGVGREKAGGSELPSSHTFHSWFAPLTWLLPRLCSFSCKS